MDRSLLRDYEWFVQKEASYGVSPGALAGADAFKHTSNPFVTRRKERYHRDRDRDANQASVITVQGGRERSATSIECDLIPSGNGTTPTEPDTDVFLEAGFGQKHKATAHTTLAAGSTTTILNFAVGGVAASGTQIGDMIAVDVSAAAGYEVRQVTAIATDAVTVDRALSEAPATGRAVKVGTTYRLLYSALPSVYLWRFNANVLRYVVPGFVIQEIEAGIDFAQGTPVATVKFSGEGSKQATQSSTSRPTPVTGGLPLVPTESKLWFGAVKLNPVNTMFNLKSGLELRAREGHTFDPTGVKRTGQNNRYEVNATYEFYASSGTPDTKTYYDNAPALGGIDALIQMGITPGAIVAWRTPSFRPDGDESEQEGEVGYRLAGRALGVTGDDEIALAFL